MIFALLFSSFVICSFCLCLLLSCLFKGRYSLAVKEVQSSLTNLLEGDIVFLSILKICLLYSYFCIVYQRRVSLTYPKGKSRNLCPHSVLGFLVRERERGQLLNFGYFLKESFSPCLKSLYAKRGFSEKLRTLWKWGSLFTLTEYLSSFPQWNIFPLPKPSLLLQQETERGENDVWETTIELFPACLNISCSRSRKGEHRFQQFSCSLFSS